MNLATQAEKAGIGAEIEPCPRCAGTGGVLKVDGLDLLRIREKAGLSLYAWAKRTGYSPGFVKMVEETDPEKDQRRCPEELLKLYLDLAKGKAPEERTPKAEKARLERQARANRGAKEAPPVVTAGGVWERRQLGKGARSVRRVEVVIVEDNTVIVKRWDKPGAAWPISLRTFVLRYRDVTKEAKG